MVCDLLDSPVEGLEDEIRNLNPWFCENEFVTPISIDINGVGPISFPLVEHQLNELIKNSNGLITISNSKDYLIPNEFIKMEEWNKTLSRIFLFIREKLIINKDKEIDFKLLNIVISNKDSNSLRSIIPNNHQLDNKGKLFIVFPSKSNGGEILITEEKEEEEDDSKTSTSVESTTTTSTNKRKLSDEVKLTTKATKLSTESSPSSKNEFKQTKFKFNGTIGPKVSFVCFLLKYGHSFEIKPVETGLRLYLEYDFALNDKININTKTSTNTNTNTNKKEIKIETKNNIQNLKEGINKLFSSNTDDGINNTMYYILNKKYDLNSSTLSTFSKSDEMVLNKLKIIAKKLNLYLYYTWLRVVETSTKAPEYFDGFESEPLSINLGYKLIDCLASDLIPTSQKIIGLVKQSEIIPSNHFCEIFPSYIDKQKHDYGHVVYIEEYQISSLIISKIPLLLKKDTIIID
ncbi:hypothetical protein ACTFIY_008641 [Dictyostelium cf. discoideum]